MRAGQIRVASIPSGHPYVSHLAPPDADDGSVRGSSPVHRLPDPRPLVVAPQPGQWWPPAMLDPRWVATHGNDFDVMHVHFGFDTATPEDLGEWIGQLRRHRKPLVMTVHDLVNPHFADPTAHLAQLDVLIAAADGLVTLTARAAAQIRSRWGRTAAVIPHPHVVPLDRLPAQPRPRPHRVSGTSFIIGVHAKNLRANLDPLPVLSVLLDALPAMPTATLRVDVHREILDATDGDERTRAFRGWLRDNAAHPRVEVHSHDRFTDEELYDYLEGLDLAVLPYRFGTHSGWLEACVDLGTGVLVPSIGCYRDQHGHPAYTLDPTDGTGSLNATIRRIHDGDLDATPPRPDRARQRAEIAVAHEQLYRRVQGALPG